jgi:tetraacyldisaccharide 4'-kinase
MRLQAPSFWEKSGPMAWFLWPISILFGCVTLLRRSLFRVGVFKSTSLPVPVIFVGNIRVGGTGKTPTVIALAQALERQGFSPGIISRGYQSNLLPNESMAVLATHTTQEVGDEPLLIKKQVGEKIPVWIGVNRGQAGLALLQAHPNCNVIISDDGLQHLALARTPARFGGADIELVVRDARGEGNGLLLPAGPLREVSSRARDLTLNLQIVNDSGPSESSPIGPQNFVVACAMGDAYQLTNPAETRQLASFADKPVLAVAGIADPQKFIQPLKNIGLLCTPLVLGDHANYAKIDFDKYLPPSCEYILMTEKDAVKCGHMHDSRIWVVPLQASLPQSCVQWISQILHRQSKRS